MFRIQLLDVLLRLKCVEKGRPLFVLGDKVNIAIKLVDYKFTYDKAQANSVSIYLPFFVLKSTKKLKKFVLILSFNSFTIIDDGNSDIAILQPLGQ